MVIASGFVEVNGLDNVEKVMKEMKKRGVEVNEIEKEKVTFFIEKATIDDVKAELDSLKSIEDIRNVHLAYYSLEGADEGPEFKSKEMGNA